MNQNKSCYGKTVLRFLCFLALTIGISCEQYDDAQEKNWDDDVLVERAGNIETGCEEKCSSSCECGWTEIGCKDDSGCQTGLYCKIRANLGNRCLKKPTDDSNNDNDNNDDNDNTNDNCHTYPPGHGQYCNSSCKCDEGKGDCDKDADCKSGLVCKQQSGTDFCVKPDDDGGDKWRFIVVGDSRGSDNGVNTSVWGHLVDAIVDENPEFVLFPGDLTTHGDKDEFEQWIDTSKPLYDARIGLYVCRGNHDDRSDSRWRNAFSGSYGVPQNGPSGEKGFTYSFKKNNAFFAAIDNYSSSNEVNQSWLDIKLASNTKPHVFVFGHEPAFAAGHSDCLDDHRSSRDDFWEGLKDAGARVYFAGHDHFYDHARIDDRDGNKNNDIHQYIVGTAGASLTSFSNNYSGNNGDYRPIQVDHAKKYGYLLVEISGRRVTLTFMERSGSSYKATDTLRYTAR